MSLLNRLKVNAKEWLPDSLFLSISHRQKIGRFPNLKTPATFNEKILHRCLHPDPRYVELTDKLAVRDYVERAIGIAHLIPLISTIDQFTKATFDSLPDSFVMKANHGSGFVKIVRRKAETSFDELSELATKWLHTDFYRIARERHYRNITPRVFFEELLLDSSGEVPPDMKVHCFTDAAGNTTFYTLVISDRFTPHPRGDFYDAEWSHLDISIGHYPRSEVAAPPPKNLDKMLEIAGKLARSFEYVRVDLYAPDDRILFGELTFTPGAGVYRLRPEAIDYNWGRLFHANLEQ
jgi:hypothetical protein